MIIHDQIKFLTDEINHLRSDGKKLGLVPTMGALHDGHLSLVKHSFRDNDLTAVSIFVNPIQFNNIEDLKKYPGDLQKDLEKLGKILRQNDLVFTPDVNEMYRDPVTHIFDFGNLNKVMEGKYRKGHFNGVAIIVSKLLEIFQPDKAYFGQKDFQQLVIIKSLVKQLDLPVTIVSCPIVREHDGLAMSSRNVLLLEKQRKEAALIPETLFSAVQKSKSLSVKELKRWVIKRINNNPELRVEYFEIVDNIELFPIKSWEEKKEKYGCIAVNVGTVRLIDNVKFPE
ncbi:MAG: pantoate--beta-alanine ligase [Bacteroidales bacterium]|nr:pantoate--beta-alanine ligase [Bacteroidales bacterium]